MSTHGGTNASGARSRSGTTTAPRRAIGSTLSPSARRRTNARLPIDPEYQRNGITARDTRRPVEFTSARVLSLDRTKAPPDADPRLYSADPPDARLAASLRPGGRFQSYEGRVRVDDAGRPQNPWGPTGISGRGVLRQWGANRAADAIVTRVNARGQLEVATIVRARGGEIALPGGMVDRGERQSSTVAREFGEEASARLNFSRAPTVYRGYVPDPRNTDNAWMETDAFHLHLGARRGQQTALHAASDAQGAAWRVVDSRLLRSLYANHGTLVRDAIANWERRTGNQVQPDGTVVKPPRTPGSPPRQKEIGATP